jgi:[acyl-carrier-protein] S-malonyltransferase
VMTVSAIIDGGVSSIIECGPGKVLAGLCRRINRGFPVAVIDSCDNLQKSLLA